MGHLEMDGDIMGYKNCAGQKREKNRGLSRSCNIFDSLKCNSTKFCMLIENIKQFPRQLHCCDVIGHMTLADGIHRIDIKVHKVYLMSHLFRIPLGYLKRASNVFLI